MNFWVDWGWFGGGWLIVAISSWRRTMVVGREKRDETNREEREKREQNKEK